MKKIELSESEINSVSDLLLFKSIVVDKSDVVVDIIKRFGIDPKHRLLGLCEPMSYISQNFIEISQFKNRSNDYRKRFSTVSAMSVLEEQINKEFCTKGIHALELAIKIDALSVFHALLDIGHKDYDSEAVHLAVKHLRPDMLSRLQEEGFDLWKGNKEWGSRPIDTLHLMISFKDELSIMSVSDLYKKFTECLQIIINSAPLEKLIEDFKPYDEENSQYPSNWRIIRQRNIFCELDTIFYNSIHGIDGKDI
jgi:hypothetical protein